MNPPAALPEPEPPPAPLEPEPPPAFSFTDVIAFEALIAENQNRSFSPRNLSKMKGKIEGVEEHIFLDSCANTNLINLDVLNMNQKARIVGCAQNLNGIGSSSSLGNISLRVALAGIVRHVTFLVVRNPLVNVLIGTTGLTAFGAILDPTALL